jgi:hypothetical protein
MGERAKSTGRRSAATQAFWHVVASDNSSLACFSDHARPVDSDARRVIAPMRIGKLEGFTQADCERIRWMGAISRCPSCGDRAYLHGWCFGCRKGYS